MRGVMTWDPAKHPRGHHGLFVGVLGREAEHALTEADRKAEQAMSPGDAKRIKDLKRLGLDKLFEHASGLDQSFRTAHRTQAHKEALHVLGSAASKPGDERLIAAYVEAQGTLTAARELSQRRHAYVQALAEKLKQPGLSVHDRAVIRQEIKHNTVLEQDYAEQLPRLEAAAEQARKRLTRAAKAPTQRSEEVGRPMTTALDERARMSAADINNLPDSDFAYIEPGGTKDSSGKTVPRSLRHFPIHDAAHVRNALARIAQGARFGDKALPKVRAAAKRFGIEVSDNSSQRSYEESSVVAVERRFTKLPVELRAAGDQPRIGGYAAVFNKLSRNLGGFVETVNPAFFNKSRGDGWPEVRARFNHEDRDLLGTTGAGTLHLVVDDTGLDYEVTPPRTGIGPYVVELAERRDISKSSFAFRCVTGGDDWTMSEQGYPLRSLISGQLIDVAPLTKPEAYTDTSASLRSLAEKFDADPEEVRSLAEADDLRRFFVRSDVGARVTPKKRIFGPSAAAQLLARRADPWE